MTVRYPIKCPLCNSTIGFNVFLRQYFCLYCRYRSEDLGYSTTIPEATPIVIEESITKVSKPKKTKPKKEQDTEAFFETLHKKQQENIQ